MFYTNFIMKRRYIPRPDQEGPLYLTPAGIERLKVRLERLKHSLPELISETARTAAYGDRSENAEYQAAKSLLRRTHRQIETTENQLKRAVPIMKGAGALGAAQIGSTVVLETKNGKQKTFEIVGPHETDPARGRISHMSPLGVALIGHKKGDAVSLVTPVGRQDYRILDVT